MTKKIFLMLMVCGIVFSQSAYIVDQTNAVRDVFASSAYKVYVDSLGSNPDLALRICSVGQKDVAAVYSASLGGGVYDYTDLSWNLTTGSTNTLVYTPNALGGPGCYQTPVDSYAFSQFKDNTRTPPVFVSAFPGRIHVLYSDNVDGSSPSFVSVPTANGWLHGSYAVTRDFNQGLNRVRATVTGITFETDSGTVTKPASDADWGLNSSTGRSMVVALCTDDIGDNCSDGAIVNSVSQFPLQLNIGLPVSDQVIYNRNVVVDGLGYPICVGSDVSAAVSANPTSSFPGQTSNITVTLTNNGNVGITTDFLLYLNISGPAGYENDTSFTITENLAAGASTTRNLSWRTGNHTGTYTVTARADPTNLLVECDKSNNNATTQVTTVPIYTLHVIIDGNTTSIFPIWGRPYNVTMWITDSDGANVPNPRYDITETNGLNPFTPTQVWTSGVLSRGLKSMSVGEITGNASGYIQITMVPTCNLLYTLYSGEGVDAYVGNYSIKVNGYAPSPLLFLYNNTLTYDVPLQVNDYTCADPGWVNNKEIFNKNKYVTWVYDWIYQVYSNTKKLVVP
jgi:hypothetical protein